MTIREIREQATKKFKLHSFFVSRYKRHLSIFTNVDGRMVLWVVNLKWATTYDTTTHPRLSSHRGVQF